MASLKTFLAGGCGGASLVIVGQPLDTVKVRMQADTSGLYKGTVDCITQAIRKDGPFSVPPLHSHLQSCPACPSSLMRPDRLAKRAEPRVSL